MLKNSLVILSLSLSSLVFAADAPKEQKKETKKVCVMQKDSNTKKDKEVCRVVRVHKKLEGTKVPEKK